MSDNTNEDIQTTERINKMLVVQALLHLDGRGRLAPAIAKLKSEGAYPFTEPEHFDRAFAAIAETLTVELRNHLDGNTFQPGTGYDPHIPPVLQGLPVRPTSEATPAPSDEPVSETRFDDAGDFSILIPDPFIH